MMESENAAILDGPSSTARTSPATLPSNSTACLFHCLFKGLAIFSYLFFQIFHSGFILNFIVCVLLLSFDFWTVKNVTGRLLVGLRWWNLVKEDGTNEWVFEARQDTRPVNPHDERVFWIAINLAPVIWIFFAMGTVLHPQWLLICVIGATLSSANTYGYFKCKRDAGKKLKSMVADSAMRHFAAQAFGGGSGL